MLSTGEVPGLQSVATAIAAPLPRSNSTGGIRVSRNIRKAPGSSTATTPASAMAATPASLVYSIWSADRAR